MNNLMEQLRQSNVTWRIRRYFSICEYLLKKPYKVSTIEGNVLLNEGINFLWTYFCTGSGSNFGSSNAFIGVGDDSTAAAVSQTGLNPGVVGNILYKAMTAGYPTYGTDQKCSWKSVFGAGEANFEWREFTTANGNSNAYINLNRKVSNQGLKSAPQIWEIEISITLS